MRKQDEYRNSKKNHRFWSFFQLMLFENFKIHQNWMNPNPIERQTYTTRVAKRPEYYIVIYSLSPGQINFGPIFEKSSFCGARLSPPWGAGEFFLGKPRGYDQNEKHSPTIAFIHFQISVNFCYFQFEKNVNFHKKFSKKKKKNHENRH